MPVLLQLHYEKDCPNPDFEPYHLLVLLQPFPAQEMKAYPVSTLVNVLANVPPR